MADGRELMTARMYTSLSEIFEGWSKNAYLGLEERAWLLLVAVFFGNSAKVTLQAVGAVAGAASGRFGR